MAMNAKDCIEKITLNCEFITAQEKEALVWILQALNQTYRTFVMAELERQSLFDSRRPTKAILLNRLQEIILDIADKKAKTIRLNTGGKYLTDYESKRYKRMYCISRIVDITDCRIKYFLRDLKSRAMQ